MGGDPDSYTTPPDTETRNIPGPTDSLNPRPDNGTVFVRGSRFHVSRTLFDTLAYLVETDASLLVSDGQGALLIE